MENTIEKYHIIIKDLEKKRDRSKKMQKNYTNFLFKYDLSSYDPPPESWLDEQRFWMEFHKRRARQYEYAIHILNGRVYRALDELTMDIVNNDDNIGDHWMHEQ
jgi:hypothetical protein